MKTLENILTNVLNSEFAAVEQLWAMVAEDDCPVGSSIDIELT